MRLGDDAFIQGTISDDKVGKMLKTMRAFRDLMDVYDVSEYFACATSAMREAENGPTIVDTCKEIGVDIHIIDGAKEAEIIYSSHLEHILDDKKVYLYIDVGGGSTEISLFANARLVDSQSFNLGTIRILDNRNYKEVWDEMKEWIKRSTRKYKAVYGIGTGGNINKLSRFVNAKEDKPFNYDQMHSVYRNLASLSVKERITELGLKKDRADVIVPAAEIFLTIMKAGKLKNIFAPRVGLVDGIIQTLINEKYGEKIG